jgi:hypothetical protein
MCQAYFRYRYQLYFILICFWPLYVELRPNVIMKMAVFWDVAPCCLTEIYRHFKCAYCLHREGVEAVRSGHTVRRYRERYPGTRWSWNGMGIVRVMDWKWLWPALRYHAALCRRFWSNSRKKLGITSCLVEICTLNLPNAYSRIFFR